MAQFGDVSTATGELGEFVATVEIHRPPDNYFDAALIASLADAFESLDRDHACRAIVLCSEGKHFCAGARFAPAASGVTDGLSASGGPSVLYGEAVRLLSSATPVVAAVQGAAVGGGLGLACAADFRVGWEGSRLSANFARLGFHQGFGLSVTLPAIVGQQQALNLLYTGRRLKGDEASAIGLLDRLADSEAAVRHLAAEMASEIAQSAPLAVRSIRETMRGGLAEQVRAACEREAEEQDRLRHTADWAEGVRAAAERRAPRFEGR